MKKLFYIILFSLCICSCSKDDDMFNEPASIIGTWQDRAYGETFIFGENKVKLITMTGDIINLDYVFTGDEITFTEYVYVDNSDVILSYKNKIKELENEVKTARGESRLALLDRIAYFRSLLYEACLNQSDCVYTYSSKVTKFTFNELSFYIDDTEYNLTRIND